MLSSADLDRDPLDRRRDELLGRHLEAPVAVDRPHRAVGTADLGADGGRDREAHRAEAARVDPRVRLVELPVLRRPHLVLADAGGEDRALAAPRRGASPGRTAASAPRPARSARRSAGTARASPRCGSSTPTCRPASAPPASRSRIALMISSVTYLQSPTIGTSGRRTLPCSAGSMSTWMILASGAKLSTRPVMRSSKRAPRAISRSLRCSVGDRRGVAVHARHAEAQRVVVGERAARHQRGDDVDVGQLGELAHLLGGAGLEDAAADVEHRALGLQDQPGRLLDHPRVALGRSAGSPGSDAMTSSSVGQYHSIAFCSTSLGTSTSTGPGPPGRGEVERLADRQREVLGASSPARCAW